MSCAYYCLDTLETKCVENMEKRVKKESTITKLREEKKRLDNFYHRAPTLRRYLTFSNCNNVKL